MMCYILYFTCFMRDSVTLLRCIKMSLKKTRIYFEITFQLFEVLNEWDEIIVTILLWISMSNT